MNNGLISIKKIRLVFAVIVIVTIFLIALMVYRSVTFRIVGTDPSTNAVSTISPFFKINFNKRLAKTVSVSVLPQNLSASYDITGSSVTVKFSKQFQEGGTYYIHLTKIADVEGKHLPDKTISFVAQAISSSDLSPDQQQALANNQARFNAIMQDGLVKLLPFSGGGNEFQVSYTISYSGQDPRLIIIVTASTNQGKDDALNWIRQVGFDPLKYTITYANPFAND